MNARKILEFSPNGPSLFFRFLEHLAKEQGWDFQFEQQTEFHTQLLDEASMANVDMNLSGTILPQLHVLPTLVRTVQCLDAFVQEDGHWYPRLIFFDALRAVLVDRARDLDIRLPAFVVGHLDQARAVCAVLAE
ncbi:MAG TPA: hypothetical protein VN132_10200, partial [Bdellovibrio sp.]|nr:hypothetical protein [Bdellovibrio sp.]